MDESFVELGEWFLRGSTWGRGNQWRAQNQGKTSCGRRRANWGKIYQLWGRVEGS